MTRLLYYAIVAIVLGQSVYGLLQLAVERWHATVPGIVERVTASDEERIRRAFGEDAAILDLIAATVPEGALVFVDWPITFQAAPDAIDVGAEATPVIRWLETVERVRMLLYPTPTVFRMQLNAFAVAEQWAALGASVWLLAPGDAQVAAITPSLPAAVAQLPAAFGIPRDRAGWSNEASNSRCQLWNYTRD